MNIARRVALLSFVCMFFTLVAFAAATLHWRVVCCFAMILVFVSALSLILVAALADRRWATKVKCEKCNHETPWDWRNQIITEFTER